MFRLSAALAIALAPLFLATAQTDKARVDAFGDPLPPGALARLGTIGLKHTGDVQAVAFSPDGKYVASGGADLGIRFWNVDTGKRTRILEGHSAPIRALAFVRGEKGTTLISAGQDGTIRFWNADTGAELKTQIEHPGAVAVMAVSSDGKTIATGSSTEEGSSIYLWNAHDGKEIRNWKAHSGPIMALAFSAEGKLASGANMMPANETEERKDEPALVLWDPAKGEKIHAFPEHAEVRGLAFSPDGKRLASTGTDKAKARAVRLWDTATAQELRRFRSTSKQEAETPSLAFSPDGKTLAGGESFRILLWDMDKEAPPKAILHAHRTQVNALAFSADSSMIASAGAEGGVGIWDLAKRGPRFEAEAHTKSVNCVAVSSDGKMIATGSYDTTARLWDRSGKMLRVLRQPVAKDKDNPLLGPSLIWCVAFTPDNKTVALAHNNGQITYWDPPTGKMTHTIEQGFNRMTSISFSPDGKWLLTNSWDDFEVYLREAGTGKEVRQYSRGEDRGASATLSPDARFVASPARGLLYLWDTDTGKLLYKKEKAGLGIAFCPASLLLATATGQEIHILDAATGTDLGQLEGRTGNFNMKGLAFSPDGLLLAVAEEDRASLWDVANRQPVREFFGHRAPLTSVAFSGDGQLFVTGSEDGTALVWDVAGVVSPKKLDPVKPAEMPTLWAGLKDGDRLRGYPSYLRMRQSAGPVTAFLAKQLHPILPASLERIPKFIKDLDSPAVTIRNKAAEELEKLGDAGEKELREGLKKATSLETTQRIEKLLEKMTTSPEAIRQHWALRLLEEFKTLEARKLLEHLSTGTPLSRLTREAQSSLKRAFATP